MDETSEIVVVVQGNGLVRIERPILESTMISWEALIDPEWEKEDER